ncbi:MAG TPA: disulfide bond formation protein B [Devosia sp.]|nr:disulfide bond formation protein B [Devosia sp.]
MADRLAQFSGNNANRANTAFMIGFFTIVGAWGFELIGGYQPCELCLAQRIPYYIGLPLLVLIIGGWTKIPTYLRIALTLTVAAIFLWSTYLGIFHAGVEWKFWPGPTACAGTGESLDFSALSSINEARVVPCDDPEFRFLGLSFAGYNALISALVAAFLLWSAHGQVKRLSQQT